MQVDYSLHLAAVIAPGEDYDRSIRINAVGTGHVMSRFRDAKACLMMSTSRRLPAAAGLRPSRRRDRSARGLPQPYAPTYRVSKISQEAVAKFAAESFGLPTTIARMNAAYGDNGGFGDGARHDPRRRADPVMPPGHGQVASPIHEDAISTTRRGCSPPLRRRRRS
ncbi:MAG: SDR family oxidoreductase [Myxococcota bacterium]